MNQVDTLSNYMDTSQVIALYSDMLDKQTSQFTILISVLCGIVVLIVAATWWWNYRGARAQITEEIQSGLKKYQRLLNSHKASMEKQVSDEVEKIINEKLSVLSQQLKKESEEYQASIREQSARMNANLSRVFALHCLSDKDYFYSSTWWLSSFEYYLEVEDGEFEQITIDAYVQALELCLKESAITEDQHDSIDDLLERTNSIPDVYTDQRNKAKKLLNNIKKKKVEE